jgi:hypothetical protein
MMRAPHCAAAAALIATAALGLASAGCGKYGPPVRASRAAAETRGAEAKTKPGDAARPTSAPNTQEPKP